MNSKVTIAVPIYGVEQYIERCARSLFEQSENNIEYIFVDDGSPDKSIDVLERIISEYPSRQKHIQIIHHEVNRGLAAARNTAIECCQTEFIMHVDSDDYVSSEMVEKVLKRQEETDADIISFNYIEIKTSGKSEKKTFPIPIKLQSWTIQILKRKYKSVIWSLLIRTSLYKKNNIKAIEGLDMGEDYQVTPRLFYFAKKVEALEDALYYYNCNDNSYTATFNAKKTEQTLQGVELLKEFFKDKGFRYYDAACQGEAIMLAMYMMGCARANNKQYSRILKTKMKIISRTHVKQIPFSYRMTYYLRWFPLLHCYAKMGHLIKNI